MARLTIEPALYATPDPDGRYVLASELDESERVMTAYQIAKDNLELRLARAVLANEKPIVGTFAGHWTY